MADQLSQDQRIGILTTPLGANTLVLSRFDGNEALSEPFEFRVEAISLEQNLDFNGALGKSATVKLKTADDKDRYFNGILAEARWSGARQGLFVYQLVLRPWLFLLTLTSDCRIFPKKTAPQIIKQVFSDRGFSDFRDGLQSSYPQLEYTVQYRETDFDFVSRLMEKFGIYYFFEYEDGKHTLVLADGKSSHKAIPQIKTFEYTPTDDAGKRASQHVDEWSRGRAIQSGNFKLNDYDYKKPPANLLGHAEKPGGYAHDSMEMYDYPGEYDKQSDGDTLAKVEAEAAQSLDDRRTGTGSALSLFPGGLVTLSKHKIGAENQEYLVVACSHFFHAQQYRSGSVGGAGGGASSGDIGYVGNYEFTPSSRQFRAELDTPRPEIPGVQSALVIKEDGKEGEEIDVDDKGRICVQFYWDRKKKPSRRVRIAQFWAGKARGAWFLPRIGDEVLVQYEDGDPDRPIVTGSVYNGTNEVPMKMPDKKTQSGILTKSSKHSDGYNMLMFDDTKDQERVKLRSQKDLMFKALNNEQRDILMSQTENVGKDETINVGMDMGHDLEKGGGNWTLNAFKTATINVGPQGMPMTSIAMTQQDITLSVGPEGLFAKIVMNADGITLSVMGGLTEQSWSTSGITMLSTSIDMTVMDTISLLAPVGVSVAPTLQTPALVAGAAVISGIPI